MKYRSLFFAAFILFAACVREEQAEEPVLKTFDCFTVSVEETEMTKVHMENGGAVKWDLGDRIGIYSDTHAPVPYYRDEDGKFRGEAISGTVFYAFFPFDPYSSFSIDSVFEYDNDNISKLGVCCLDGITDTQRLHLPMVAKSETNHLSFRQTCGLLHFTIKGEFKVDYVYLYSKDLGAIRGKGSVDYHNENPILELNCGNGKVLEENTQDAMSYMFVFFNDSEAGKKERNVYFPLPVMSLNGFTIRIGIQGSTIHIEKSTDKTISIERGKIVSFTCVDLDKEVEEVNRIHEQERNALVALYNSLDGDNWVNNTNWCSEKPVGEWYGVNAPYGFVTDIWLAENNLRGQIPPEIGDFSHLESLNINNESGLVGPIPPEIGKLSSLRSLVLLRTGISGRIPPEIGSLENLESLVLVINHLSGTIPEEIGNCRSLEVLELSNNELSGSIPESIGQLSKLRILYLDSNSLTGSIPESMGNLTSLNAAYLLNNYLSGPVPVSFMALDFWEYMWPWEIFQYDCRRDGNGLDPDSFILRGPRFSVSTCDGESIDDSIYDNNEFTLLVEFRSYNVDQLNQLRLNELYNNYKKKGLEIVGYGSDMSNEEMLDLTKIWKLPGKYFHYDRATEYSGYQNGGTGNVFFLSNTNGPAVNVVDRKRNIVFEPYYTDFFSDYDTLYRFIEKRLGTPDPLDEGDDDPAGDPYSSTDYSADGSVRVFQRASEGAGINVVLLGDAFTDRLIADGTYDSVMEKGVEALFSEEPYKSYRNHFNVYIIYAVSEHDIFGGRTALDTKLSSGTEVSGDDEKVKEYISNAIPGIQLQECLTLVLLNKKAHFGTCYLYDPSSGDWGNGFSISYCTLGINDDDFVGQILHEAGGHGFAKLDDEYVAEMAMIPNALIESKRVRESYGWWRNVDYTSTPTQVKWAQFIADDRYSSSEAGIFEGGGTFLNGVWRSTMNSIMRYNEGGFNAQSRYAIWYRINKLAYGEEWTGSYDDFVSYDRATRNTAVSSTLEHNRIFVEMQLPPLHSPVMVNLNW